MLLVATKNNRNRRDSVAERRDAVFFFIIYLPVQENNELGTVEGGAGTVSRQEIRKKLSEEELLVDEHLRDMVKNGRYSVTEATALLPNLEVLIGDVDIQVDYGYRL